MSPAARLPVSTLRRRVAARRLSRTKSCVSSVGAGAPSGRAAIHCSASSSTGERRRSPFGCPASDQRRACSPNSVCRLIQPMSVPSASASRSALASNRASSSKMMKLSLASTSGTALSSTGRHTIGAKRLFSEAANATSLRATSDATESGLSTNTTVSACAISASMRFHQSSKAWISVRSMSGVKPRDLSAASSRSAKAMSLRE